MLNRQTSAVMFVLRAGPSVLLTSAHTAGFSEMSDLDDGELLKNENQRDSAFHCSDFSGFLFLL